MFLCKQSVVFLWLTSRHLKNFSGHLVMICLIMHYFEFIVRSFVNLLNMLICVFCQIEIFSHFFFFKYISAMHFFSFSGPLTILMLGFCCCHCPTVPVFLLIFFKSYSSLFWDWTIYTNLSLSSLILPSVISGFFFCFFVLFFCLFLLNSSTEVYFPIIVFFIFWSFHLVLFILSVSLMRFSIS